LIFSVILFKLDFIMTKYNPAKIERKWQRHWDLKKLYRAKDKSSKPKYYQLETFPYPSAAGLHVGHPKGYIAEDIHARYMRMKGKEVMYTMGWDAFGLPTENYAIKVGKSPKDVARSNIKNFKRQLKMFGFSYDWDREINTSSPEYYKWTQWIFLQLFKAGLAYQKMAKVNWCPSCMTVLANEQVVDGKCERCGSETTQKEMKQWFFKITDYTERLLTDLEGLDWPEATVKRQKDWIGKSVGAKVRFPVKDSKLYIEVFTTRADTLFGGTYLILAPEYQVIKNLESKIQNLEEVNKYVKAASHKTELMRQEEAKDKTGVELKGVKAINPATKEEMPVWVADFVLSGYGTGAVFADAHDERDFEFAKKFGIKLKPTLRPEDGKDEEKIKNLETCFTGEGVLYDSAQFSGMKTAEAKTEIVKWLKSLGLADFTTNYKLRDWSVSRQRYWGAPIPIIYCSKCGTVSVPEKDLPVKLPDLKDYRPKGMPPLASSEKFMKIKCPSCGGAAQRDPETLDTFVDSSWYYLRYTHPQNDKKFADDAKLKLWLPVKLYVIGAEHTVLHLLYSRFITKFLYDQGYLHFKEPFLKLRHLGLILGSDGQKMSKSKGNVVNPDEIVGQYGADAVRLYEMFMGPFEDGQPWDPKGVVGTSRFLNRVWNLVKEAKEPKFPDKEVGRILNRHIKEIGDDIKFFKFNTGVSGLMKLLNALENKWLTKDQYGIFLKLLCPFAPHITEELWHEVLKKKTPIHIEEWPKYDEALLAEEMVTIAIQINGKLRGTIEAKKGLSEEDVKKLVLAEEKIKKDIQGKNVKKFIYVKDRLTNLVI